MPIPSTNRVMPPSLAVIHEDDLVVALAKPAGWPISPDPKQAARPSLLAEMRQRFGPGIANVHRIDDEASGLVLFAKTKPALDFLSGQFQSKTVDAVHLALTVGATEASTGTIDYVVKIDEGAPDRMCVVKKHGQAAVTEYAVQERFGRLALLACHPKTSRRHQLRLHLATANMPILNDSIYGNGTVLLLSDLKRGYKGREDERPLISRLALHAAELTFRHPATREPVSLKAPLPNDFEVALKYLRKFCK